MTYERALRFVAAAAMLPAGATFYFWVFWTWFDAWRRRPVLTYLMMFGSFAGFGVALYALRGPLLAARLAVPFGLTLVGWWLIGRTWVAEELGIALTAVAALVVGVRWATVGWREPAVAT